MSAPTTQAPSRARSLLARLRSRELAAIADQGTISGSNFLTNVMIARFLGADQFGAFALAWMVVLFAGSLQWALLVSPMMSLVPKQSAERRPFFFGVIAAQACGFAVLAASVVFAGVHLGVQLIPKWHVAGLAVPLAAVTFCNLLQDFARRYFFATGRVRHALANDAVSYLGQLPLLWLVHARGHLNSQTALLCICVTSSAAVLLALPHAREFCFEPDAFHEVTRTNWNFSRWLIPSALMQWTSGNLFIVFAPIYYGAAAAGVLRAAQNLVGVAHVWFLGLDNVVPAEASRALQAGGSSRLTHYLGRVLLRWGAFTALFMLVLAVAPNFWLHLVYGKHWSGSGLILQLYALLYVQVFLNGPLRSGLQALESTRPIFWSYLAMTTFAVLFAGPFTRWMGLRGAIFGVIGTQIIFQTFLAVSLFRRLGTLRRKELASAPPNRLSLSATI